MPTVHQNCMENVVHHTSFFRHGIRIKLCTISVINAEGIFTLCLVVIVFKRIKFRNRQKSVKKKQTCFDKLQDLYICITKRKYDKIIVIVKASRGSNNIC